MNSRQNDWDPYSPAAQENQIALGDEIRHRCPVAYSEALGWSLFRHEDVMRALDDPATFSNVVSSHMSVPNGMDPPQHTDYRALIEPYFAPERMTALEPKCRALVRESIAELPDDGEFDPMDTFADEFALQAQCAFLNWPVELHRPLRDWVRKNHAATRSRDRHATAVVAFEFDLHIRAVLADRRASGLDATDVASELLREQVRGRALTDEEIVSILRNWTVGELATISACIGIIVAFLADHPEIQSALRANTGALPLAIDEILRIESSLIASRRVTTCPVKIDEQSIERGARVTLMWAAANRDEHAFERPNEFRLDRNHSLNLLYGAGVHVCPGAPLARLELRVLTEALLRTFAMHSIPGKCPTRAVYPASGFSRCPVRIARLAVSK